MEREKERQGGREGERIGEGGSWSENENIIVGRQYVAVKTRMKPLLGLSATPLR